MKLTNEQRLIKIYGEEWNKKQREKVDKYFAEELVEEITKEKKK